MPLITNQDFIRFFLSASSNGLLKAVFLVRFFFLFAASFLRGAFFGCGAAVGALGCDFNRLDP
jgi:hypothetical protein